MTRIEQNTKTVREFMELVWSKGDVDVAERIVDPNFQFLLAFAHLDGRDAFMGLVDRNRHIFENLTYSVEPDDIVAEDFKAAVFWRMDSKHIGTWRNVPASNKVVWINGMSFFRFNEAGQLTECRVQNDVMSLMNQIGGIKKLYDF
ncbi:ester cyclase [Spirosoma aerophilum]